MRGNAAALRRALAFAVFLLPLVAGTSIIIGGLADNGVASYLQRYQLTFAKYLTETVALPNTTFATVPLDYNSPFLAAANGSIDFFFGTATLFSCLSFQYGLRPVASLLAGGSKNTNSTLYASYSAVIFTTADRSDINSLADIENKALVAVDPNSVSTQAAQLEFLSRNLSFWNSPSQVSFAYQQAAVVQGVLSRTSDVGIVDTGFLESSRFNMSLLKILNPNPEVPYACSAADLYPHWVIAALPHVTYATSDAVAAALFSIQRTDPAALTGKYSGFVSPYSYSRSMELVDHIGGRYANGSCIASRDFISSVTCPPDGTQGQNWFRLPDDFIANSCAATFQTCPDGYDCICKPCVGLPSTEFDVFMSVVNTSYQSNTGSVGKGAGRTGRGIVQQGPCRQLTACLVAYQNTEVTITVRDNLQPVRAALGEPSTQELAGIDVPPFENVSNLVQTVTMTTAKGSSGQKHTVTAALGKFTYSVNVTKVGAFLLDIHADGVALPKSPFLITVVPPICPPMQSVDIYGTCFCPAPIIRELPNGDCALPLALNATSDGGLNVSIPAVVTPSVAGFVAIVAFTVLTAVRYSRYQEQQIWLIPADKLDVSDSRVLGQGSFGLVVTGTYQGATVALKRALVNRRRVNGSGSNRDLKSIGSNAKSQLSGSGDGTPIDGSALEGVAAAGAVIGGDSAVAGGEIASSWVPNGSAMHTMTSNRRSIDIKNRRSSDMGEADRHSLDATAVNIGSLDAHSVAGPHPARRASDALKRRASSCCCASSDDDEQAPGFVRSVESKARSAARGLNALMGNAVLKPQVIMAKRIRRKSTEEGTVSATSTRNNSVLGRMMSRATGRNRSILHGKISGLHSGGGAGGGSGLNSGASGMNSGGISGLNSGGRSGKSSSISAFGLSGSKSSGDWGRWMPTSGTNSSGLDAVTGPINGNISGGGVSGKSSGDLDFKLTMSSAGGNQGGGGKGGSGKADSKGGSTAVSSERQSWDDWQKSSGGGSYSDWAQTTFQVFVGCCVGHRGNGSRAQLMREAHLVVKLRHPNIVSVFGMVREYVKEPVLVMECAEYGSLYDLLRNTTLELDNEAVMIILRDIVNGMSYLHSNTPDAILHNDLKAPNVMIDASFRAKISDFGLSSKRMVTGMAGSPFWMAPELLNGGKHSPATDVYAYGILVSEVCRTDDPYESTGDDTALLREVADTRRQPPRRPEMPSNTPKLLLDLCAACWANNPLERPTFEDLRVQLSKASISGSWRARRALHGKSKGDIEAELARQRALLAKVFPARVAEQLLEGRTVEPQSYDCVTVFFSDIVGFTDMSATLSAHDVLDMLDRLYTVFDKVTEKHRLFKVETIGDAYLVCGNIIEEGASTDHTARMGDFALDLVEAAQATLVKESDPSLGFVSIRAGFHCGKLVASVVGKASPRFSLYGDTVNVASRMESNSKAGCVNLSLAAAMLLAQQSPALAEHLVARGEVEVKGKGKMEMFWLTRSKNADGRKVAQNLAARVTASETNKQGGTGHKAGNADFAAARNTRAANHMAKHPMMSPA